MNYIVKNEEGLFHVYETQTNQVIKSYAFFSEAKKMMKRLNSGIGFGGWTPSFILTPVKNLASDTK